MPMPHQEQINDIRKWVFLQPVMEQDEVLNLFREMDDLLSRCSSTILDCCTRWAEDFLTNDIIRVAAGSTHGRTIFERDTSDNKKPEERFLAYGNLLIHAMTYRDPQRSLKPYVKQLVAKTRFARVVFEDMVMQFVRIIQKYPVDVRATTSLHNKMQRRKDGRYVPPHGQVVRRLLTVHKRLDADVTRLSSCSSTVLDLWQQYIRIRDLIVKSYMRIVYRESLERASSPEQVLENLQYGTGGLIRAVSCYNIGRKVHFSAYAKLWVRQAVLYWIKESSSVVKLPAMIWQTHAKLEDSKARHYARTGVYELPDQHSLSDKALKKIEVINESMRAMQAFSLNYPVGEHDDDGGTPLESTLGTDEFCEKIAVQDIRQYLEQFSDAVPEKQARYLMLHIGLVDMLPGRDVSAKDIARERIRQTTLKPV